MTLPFVGTKADGTGYTRFGYIFGYSSNYSHTYYLPSSLKTVVITGSDNISERAFYGCIYLTKVVIASCVENIGKDAFYGCSSLTIYCCIESQPSGWDEKWNSSSRPIVWNYEFEHECIYQEEICKICGNSPEIPIEIINYIR